jgi:hypothetical protein
MTRDGDVQTEKAEIHPAEMGFKKTYVNSKDLTLMTIGKTDAERMKLRQG